MAFFAGATNVDARGGTYSYINGNQVNYIDRRKVRPNPPVRPSPPVWPPFTAYVEGRQGETTPEAPTQDDVFDSSWPPHIHPDAPSQVSSPLPSPPRWIIEKPISIATEPEPPITHSERLFAVDRELAEFESEISPWNDPHKWLQDNAERIASITQELITSIKMPEFEGLSSLGHNMMYPRSTLYTFTHLTLCAKNRRLLDEFKETLRQWKSWSWLAMIQNYQSVKDALDKFQSGLSSPPGLHTKTFLRKLWTLDVIHLAAFLAVAVTDNAKYTILVDQKGSNAQALINLLQARLDYSIHTNYKSRHTEALIKLCRASQLCPECFALKDVEIDDNPVAQGGYGDVYKGRFKGQDIAVKVLKMRNDNNRLLKEFASEAVIWRQLSDPHILPFLGVYHVNARTPSVCLVSPWLEYGNVSQYLKCNPKTDCVQLALDVALGLQYLHGLTPSIVHGDLKGLNVLVMANRRACLADFGQAAVRNPKTLSNDSTYRGTGTTRWLAPEFYDDVKQHSSKKGDIYAFACLCYEMLSGEMPFYEYQHDIKIMRAVTCGTRPSQPSDQRSRNRGLTDLFWSLVEACWVHDPAKRPTAMEVVGQIRSLPNRPMDRRPMDGVPVSALSQVAIATNHPFSALLPNDADDVDMKELKWISR